MKVINFGPGGSAGGGASNQAPPDRRRSPSSITRRPSWGGQGRVGVNPRPTTASGALGALAMAMRLANAAAGRAGTQRRTPHSLLVRVPVETLLDDTSA